MIRWLRRDGDGFVANVCHVLNTPIGEVRRLPLGLLFRMHAQAARIAAPKR